MHGFRCAFICALDGHDIPSTRDFIASINSILALRACRSLT